MASANPRGRRKLVELGEFNRKVKNSEGQSEVVQETVLVRMFDDQINTLGWQGLITNAAQGKEIQAPNENGTYKFDKKGVLGQQPIVVLLKGSTEGTEKKTIHFRVPYWYPNYKITELLTGNANVSGYKRNGGFIFTDDTSEQGS